ncbi:MAG: DUF692 family protein [Mycobacterium sp.]|nr:DUF692 family protein [Mycobacterium sp.]
MELEPQTLWEKTSHKGVWRYRPNQALIDRVAAYPLAKLMHGIGQPLGGTVADPVGHLALLKSTADLLDAVWVSEHLSFNRIATPAGVIESGFLLPPHQDAGSVRIAARNVTDYRSALQRPVAFETGVNYLQPQGDELSDGAFWRTIADGADCGILLDLHNLWCNELNGRQRVLDVIDQLPLERVWEIHLAGGMAQSGYWLDAHSGRVPEPLIDLAAQVIPRLPNLGAVMFELLPEHFDSVGPDGVAEQIAELSSLWKLRSPAPGPCIQQTRHCGEPTRDDMTAAHNWEASLHGAIRGKRPRHHQWLTADPGVTIYRELVSDFRRAALAQTMRYTITLLLLGLGRRNTSELLESYFATCPAQMYRAVEAHNFACFLEARPSLLAGTRYLPDVLGFEHALIRASILGEQSHVKWTADPTEILQALDRGQLPPTLPAVPNTMLIST